MKSIKSIIAIVALSVAIPFAASAKEESKEAKKERKTKGVLVCAKCSLKKTDKCQAALTINRKGKDGKEVKRVILLKNNDVAQAFHKNICSGDKVPVSVTGKREGKKDKMVIVASKIEKAKAKKKKE